MALAIPLLLVEVAQSPQRLQRGQSRGFRDPPCPRSKRRHIATREHLVNGATSSFTGARILVHWMALRERYGCPLDSCFDSVGRRGTRRARPPSVLFSQRDP